MQAGKLNSSVPVYQLDNYSKTDKKWSVCLVKYLQRCYSLHGAWTQMYIIHPGKAHLATAFSSFPLPLVCREPSHNSLITIRIIINVN